jgi:hypothetical protein
MTKEEIIEMARQANIIHPESVAKHLEAFAKLVAKHTLLNTDPSSFMSYQEGVEVGRMAEREECAEICDGFYLSWINIQGRYEFMGEGASECAGAIRARGEA